MLETGIRIYLSSIQPGFCMQYNKMKRCTVKMTRIRDSCLLIPLAIKPSKPSQHGNEMNACDRIKTRTRFALLVEESANIWAEFSFSRHNLFYDQKRNRGKQFKFNRFLPLNVSIILFFPVHKKIIRILLIAQSHDVPWLVGLSFMTKFQRGENECE